MSNYSKSTDFASKDTLSSGDPNKIVKGTEIDAEFEAIETAVNSKINVTDIGTTVQAYDADLTTLGAGGAGARSFLGLAAIASSGSASDLSTGTVGTARLGSGTASSSTYLRGDQTWAAAVASIDGSAGVVTLSSLSAFANSLSSSGYQKLPGGLILQWTISPNGSSTRSVSLPIAFPNNCFRVLCSVTHSPSSLSNAVPSAFASSLSVISIANATAGDLAIFAIGN